MNGMAKALLASALLMLLVSAAQAQSTIVYADNYFANQIFSTYFYSTQGTIAKSSAGTAYAVSPVSAVNGYNNGNALWLLTCPMVPASSPMDQSYFYTWPESYPNMAGDICGANTQAITTSLSLETRITYGDTRTATAAVIGKLAVNGVGYLSITPLAYSPMFEGSGANTISNGWSTNSYVFQSIPSYGQSLLWTWSGTFANFANAQQQFSDAEGNEYQRVIHKHWCCGHHNESYACGNDTCQRSVCDYCDTDCYYYYDFEEETTLNSISNAYIPFNEVLGTDASGNLLTNVFDTNILPFFTLAFNAPSLNSQYLTGTYDIFSPWNYYHPNSMDMLPIDIPGILYAGYQSGTQSTLISAPGGSASSNGALASGIASAVNTIGSISSSLLQAHGLYGPNVKNPLSIAAMPTDYVFVLNSSGTGSDYYLTVLRLVPKGYYNVSNYQPTGMAGNVAQTQWDSEWNTYWNNVLQLQDNDTYAVMKIDLTQKIAGHLPSCGFFGFCVAFYYNISADTGGDVFVTGTYNGNPVVAELKNVISSGGNPTVLVSSQQSLSSGSVPTLYNIAASPTGGIVFASSPSSGYLYVFNGEDMSYNGVVDLTFGSSSILSGQQLLLNINDYLAKGGMYGVAFDGTVSGVPNIKSTFRASTDFDQASYHHPIGLQDVNGYIYVLDDWSADLGNPVSCGFWGWIPGHPFGVGTCPAVQMNMVIARVLNSTGYSAPISPTFVNDLWQRQQCQVSNTVFVKGYCGATGSPPTLDEANAIVTCGPSPACSFVTTSTCGDNNFNWACQSSASKSSTYYSLATGSYVSGNTYPPYGWILTANVVDNAASGYSPVNFCSSASCRYNVGDLPSSYTGGYYPIGPKIVSRYAQISNPGFSVNFNDTINIVFKETTTSTGAFGSVTSPVYNELVLATELNIQNYTKIFQGQPPYACYTDSLPDSAPSGGACQYMPAVANVVAPVYTVTSPFRYVENLGAPQTLTYQGVVSSLSGAGVSGSSTPCNTLVTTGQGCGNQNLAIPQNNINQIIGGYASCSIPGTGAILVPQTTLNSIISGYALVPYVYTYTLQQGWSGGDGDSGNDGVCSASISLPSNTQTTQTLYGYARIDTAANSIQAAVEGGDTYLSSGVGQKPYVPNVTATVSQPPVTYTVEGNRQFGSVYVNVTMCDSGSSGSKDCARNRQYVLNATNSLEYGVYSYTQEFGGLDYPTYETVYGMQSASSGPQLISQSHSVIPGAGSFPLAFSNVQEASFVPLFDIYKEAVYASTFYLAMSSTYSTADGRQGVATGFEPFEYVFTDRFNNTIYVPAYLDIANTVAIGLTVNTFVSENNANETDIQVNGIAYTPAQGPDQVAAPLPAGQKVYLYYDADINYVSHNPVTDTAAALYCTYADSAHSGYIPSDCNISNPNWVGKQANSDVITYATSYNAPMSDGQCSPPANGLLVKNYKVCNIYGNDGFTGINSICTGSGAKQYCLPIFANGTGACTSQLGLFAIATTGSDGSFSSDITACGGGSVFGNARIIAVYYGSPVQPLAAEVMPLGLSANVINLASDSGSALAANEINYLYAPNATSTTFTIGSFELGYGSLSGVALVAAVAAVAGLLVQKSFGKRR